MYSKPDWVEGHSDVVMTALLCGEWTEATGDVLVLKNYLARHILNVRRNWRHTCIEKIHSL